MIARSATSERRAPGESAARRPRWLSRLLFAGGLLVAGTGLFTLYLRQSRIAPFNADGASVMLQAQAMLHGNVLLSGWWTADVSFYTTELPEYMLVEVFRGLRPDVVHICGALSYTLTVLLGALLARGRATGRAGAVRALLAAGILLAPGILGGTQVFLENPDHAGTAVPSWPCCCSWTALRSAGTSRWWCAGCWPGSRSATSSASSPPPRRSPPWRLPAWSCWACGSARSRSSGLTPCCSRRPAFRSRWPGSPRRGSAFSAVSALPRCRPT